MRWQEGRRSTHLRNGQWVKHGNPSAPKPTVPCPGQSPEVVISLPFDASCTMNVKAYFGNRMLDPETDCNPRFTRFRRPPPQFICTTEDGESGRILRARRNARLRPPERPCPAGEADHRRGEQQAGEAQEDPQGQHGQ
ncbi:MAG: hypothetical protein KJ749_12700, partial [Planctomycetes bacterium]|nr:hypothetical protein [Planctomycetota bacterium]